MISKKPVGLAVVSIALILVFILDFSLWEGRNDVTKRFSEGTTQNQFWGSMTVSDLTYDDRAKSALATLVLVVKSVKKDRDIRSVAYAYQVNPDGSRDVVNCTRAMNDCFTAGGERQRPNDPIHSIATIRSPRMPIRLTEDIREIWYPFDQFSFQLDFMGSVNEDDKVGMPTPNLFLQSLMVEDSEPNYVLREKSNHYFLNRKPFIRLASVVVFLLSLVFVLHLTKLAEPKDLFTQFLGFFAALGGLRALLLTLNVNVFPTVIDYVISAEFCFLFVFIIYKVTLRTKGEAAS